MTQIAIVTGGTTGLTDGTLVDESNRIVFTSTDPLEVHVRCAAGYWSADQAFYVPEGSEAAIPLEVSFDDGGTWEGWDDNPVCPEIEDRNFPVLLRQTEAIVGTLDTDFRTDGSFTAIAALSTPTLTATVVSPSQIDLSWTNVSNEDASPGYTIERSPDGSSWAALTTKAANVTTHSDTGLTAGTHYYYRVKAEGSGRYSDSGWGADDDTTSSPTTVSFYPSGDGCIRYYTGSGTWSSVRGQATGTDAYVSNTYAAFVSSYPSLPLVARGFLAFDTSSLPDGATIISAKVKVWGQSVTGSEGTVILVDGTQAVPITTADYDNAGTTKLSDTEIALGSWSTSGYNEFPLNAAGLAAINKTGTTKFAARHSSDYNNSAPSTDCDAQARYVEHATAGNRPVLEVTYA